MGLLASTGCQREEIQAYTVQKELPRSEAHHAHDGHDHSNDASTASPKARPQVTWTLPAGWKETARGQMSVASFSITGEAGQEAQVTITPLARLAGRDAEIVNMWREQVGLEPLAREEAVKQFEAIKVGDAPANLFQIEGKPKAGEAAMRIVTAIVHREEASWFYKLAGDATLVTAQKAVFVEFLKSIRLQEAAAPAEAEVPVASESKPKWTVPAPWKQLAAGQMQVARFEVPEVSGAKAEVFVSVFPNDTGGTLANVNRWRRQIGLAEVAEADLGKIVSPLEGAGNGAVFVELKGTDKTLFGAVVPRGGSYWFYKLLGDTPAVVPQKSAFKAFATSQP